MQLNELERCRTNEISETHAEEIEPIIQRVTVLRSTTMPLPSVGRRACVLVIILPACLIDHS